MHIPAVPAVLSLLLASAAAFTTSTPSSPSCTLHDLRTLSCHNSTSIPPCCIESPSGLLLQTQYWSSLGPQNSWTIHGLWSDFCDGTYPAYCDASRAYPSAAAVVGGALEKFMRKYWLDVDGTGAAVDPAEPDQGLWKHEWDKHGTCMSTLVPGCYGAGYRPAMEAADYFKATVQLFRRLDTFKFLKKCGITPSAARTYTRAEFVGCLGAAHGATPFVGCDSEGRVNELWYYYHLRGKVVDGKWEETETTRTSSCPETGIRYLPK